LRIPPKGGGDREFVQVPGYKVDKSRRHKRENAGENEKPRTPWSPETRSLRKEGQPKGGGQKGGGGGGLKGGKSLCPGIKRKPKEAGGPKGASCGQSERFRGKKFLRGKKRGEIKQGERSQKRKKKKDTKKKNKGCRGSRRPGTKGRWKRLGKDDRCQLRRRREPRACDDVRRAGKAPLKRRRALYRATPAGKVQREKKCLLEKDVLGVEVR